MGQMLQDTKSREVRMIRYQWYRPVRTALKARQHASGTTVVDLTSEYRAFVIDSSISKVGWSAKDIALRASLHVRGKIEAGVYRKKIDAAPSAKLAYIEPTHEEVWFCFGFLIGLLESYMLTLLGCIFIDAQSRL